MEKQVDAVKNLPFDLWVDILLHLSLGDVIAIRPVCRTLYSASKSRTILYYWARRVLRSYRVHWRSLGLGRLESLTNDHLEQLILRPFALEHILSSVSDRVQGREESYWSRSLRIHKLPLSRETEWQMFALLPGGRWLFGLSREKLVCFDLGALPPTGTLEAVAVVDVHPGAGVSGGRNDSIEWEMGDPAAEDETAVLFIRGDYRLVGTEFYYPHVNIVSFRSTDQGVELVSQNRMRLPHTAWVTTLRSEIVSFTVGGLWLGLWNWKTDRICMFRDSMQNIQWARFPHCGSNSVQICAHGKVWAVNAHNFVWVNAWLTGSVRLYDAPELKHTVDRSRPLDDPSEFIARYIVEPEPMGRSIPYKSDSAELFSHLPFGLSSTLADSSEEELFLGAHGWEQPLPAPEGWKRLRELRVDRLWPQQLADVYTLRRTPVLQCAVGGGEPPVSVSWIPEKRLHFPKSTGFTWFIDRTLWVATCPRVPTPVPAKIEKAEKTEKQQGAKREGVVWKRFFDPFAHDRRQADDAPERHGRAYCLDGFVGRWVMVSPDWKRVAILDADISGSGMGGRRG